LLLGSNAAAFVVANHSITIDPFGAPYTTFYLFGHVVVVGLGLRRLHGVFRGEVFWSRPERRLRTPSTRLLQATFVVVALFTQIPLAILFGVLGPNPARYPAPVEVTLDVEGELVRREWYLIQDGASHLIAYDGRAGTILKVPSMAVREIVWLRGVEPLQPYRTRSTALEDGDPE
jgi:hypothetical protein